MAEAAVGTRFLNTSGLKKAQNQLAILAQMGARTKGIYLPGTPRGEGQLTNGQIIDYLAIGGRDIKANETDCDKAADLFKAQVEQALQKVTDGTAITPQKVGMIAAKAWRAAGRYVKELMKQRVEAGDTNSGPARKVEEAYAKARQRKYGIPEDVVYKATGQLIANLAQGDGALRLKTSGK